MMYKIETTKGDHGTVKDTYYRSTSPLSREDWEEISKGDCLVSSGVVGLYEHANRVALKQGELDKIAVEFRMGGH